MRLLFEGYCGSDGVKERFEELLQSDSLPHAILLSAEDGMGRNLFARLLAEGYLKDENGLARRGIHPDCVVLRGSGASGMIPVDAVREVAYEMNKSAVTADGKRVVIVEDASNLNRSSSAALLKTLEQPPLGVVFILTVASSDEVIDTILSRCARVDLSPPKTEEAAEFLKGMRKAQEYDKIKELSALFRGRIGYVLRALDDAEFGEAVGRAKRFAAACFEKDELAMLSALDSAKNRKELFETLSVAVFCLAERAGEPLVGAAIRQIEQLRGDLEKNVSLKLFSTVLVERVLQSE